jgi:PIN domain nuclease of toxin-antitoxin system
VRILLDTHALLWWNTSDPGLSRTAVRLLRSRSNSILVSAATAWELATKYRLGRLPQAGDLVLQLDAVLALDSFEPLPITTAHAIRAGLLPGPHKDPFDRMLIAQALAENLPVLSVDTVFDSYKVRRLWD